MNRSTSNVTAGLSLYASSLQLCIELASTHSYLIDLHDLSTQVMKVPMPITSSTPPDTGHNGSPGSPNDVVPPPCISQELDIQRYLQSAAAAQTAASTLDTLQPNHAPPASDIEPSSPTWPIQPVLDMFRQPPSEEQQREIIRYGFLSLSSSF